MHPRKNGRNPGYHPRFRCAGAGPLPRLYQAGDTVLSGRYRAFVIERVGGLDVQLHAGPSLRYPCSGQSRERFERLLQTDSRNGAITEFLPAELDLSDTDLQDVLTGEGGLLGQQDKEILSVWFATGEGNTRIAQSCRRPMPEPPRP